MQETGGEKIKGFKNPEAGKERKVKPETALTASRTGTEFLKEKKGTLDTATHSAYFSWQL